METMLPPYSKRLVERQCPQCKETSFYAYRNTYCSRFCSQAAQEKITRSAEKNFVYSKVESMYVPEVTVPLTILNKAYDPRLEKLADTYPMIRLEQMQSMVMDVATTTMETVLFQTIPSKPSIQTYNTEGEPFVDGFTVMVSDVHFPSQHTPACSALNQWMQTYAGNIKRLILAGDIFDAASLSKHSPQKRKKGSSGDLGEEMRIGAPIINAWASSADKTIMLGGNHEKDRLDRTLANEGKGIPSEPLKFENLLKTYGINAEWVGERRLDFGYGEGEVRIFHGEKYNKMTAATILSDNHFVNCGQGHTHRPQIVHSKGKIGFVNGHLSDRNKQTYMPDPDWTMGFTVLEHFNQGHGLNVYFIKITEDGEFSWCGKKYSGSALDFVTRKIA